MIISIIVAVDNNNGIGKNNSLLCKLKDDLLNFKNLTKNHCILMGRKTFESIGKPLPNRTNIIISRNYNKNYDNTFIFNNINQAIDFAKEKNENELFICGGGEIYKYFLENNLVNKIYLTQINNNFNADTFFPQINFKQWKIISETQFKKNEFNEFDFTILEIII